MGSFRTVSFFNNSFGCTVLLLLLTLASCGVSRKAKVRQKKINTVISTARTYTGVPYKYGGTTKKGMDCSGLLFTSYKTIDMSVPRSTVEQKKFGKKVKKKKVKEGDWLFFAMSKKRRKITHVGLVTQVNSKVEVKFIHASSSRGVIEDNLYKAYYKKRLRKARRPF